MKGSLIDLIVIMAVLFAVSITVLFIYPIVTSFQTALAPYPEAAQVMTNTVNYISFWDSLFILLAGGLFISAIIGASMINTHPIFFIISFIGLTFILIVTPIWSNMYIEIATSPGMDIYASQFPNMLAFYQNLPLIILSLGAMIMIVMFIRRGGGQNAQQNY